MTGSGPGRAAVIAAARRDEANRPWPDAAQPRPGRPPARKEESPEGKPAAERPQMTFSFTSTLFRVALE